MFVPVSEVFCSVQGEGPYVGYRQAFVRFTGCNLKCNYCDTPAEATKFCRFEDVAGANVFKDVKNPISPADICGMVKSFSGLHSVSLTGGEPLLNAEFISSLQVDIPLYLESNMTLPHMAKKIKNCLSYVSGDVKLLPHSLLEDPELHLDSTIECFRTLRVTKDRDCFCKIVVTKDTPFDDIEGVVGAISGCISSLILQPVTQKDMQPEPGFLLGLQESLLNDVDTRIIPQTHKMWGCL
ncbi:7-carboxy-7-deazaguanine synthase QueE [Methanolobus psychrotolerans]|uniref:7-carboxy-7-deazaguanine synthase QueE n=1 Tax=Methanolobus psychrotolerans TaxID=1874706 RepID=UPI000B919DAE|nr:7-carboxy-7-deazaguanine synthase QueE [Methanolobus psychrotolerans]